LFSFLTYTSPIWYYRLYSQSAKKLYSDDFLSSAIRAGKIHQDTSYKSDAAQKADLIYQALNVGLISDLDHRDTSDLHLEVTDPEDNYRFIRKFFP
jgi:hypothetical protein